MDIVDIVDTTAIPTTQLPIVAAIVVIVVLSLLFLSKLLINFFLSRNRDKKGALDLKSGSLLTRKKDFK